MDHDSSNEELPVIFIISNEVWGNHLFIKHYYAYELADLGYRVYFINPVGPWKIGNLVKQTINQIAISSNLTVVNYYNFLPVKVAAKFILKINDWINAIKLGKLRKGEKLIIWQFDVFRFSYNFFNNSRKIYHVVDDYRSNPFDQINIRNSDLVIYTSKDYKSHYSKSKIPSIHVPHAVSKREQVTDPLSVDKLRDIYGVSIIHAGSINDRLDIEIFEKITERFENVNLILAGPNMLKNKRNLEIFEKCKSKGNFHYLGVVNGLELKNYIKTSKVCLITYKQNEGSSSLKVFNYLAQMKPIISPIKLEYEDLEGKALYFANDVEQYLDLIDLGLSDKLFVDAKLIVNYLDENSYKRFINKILTLVES